MDNEPVKILDCTDILNLQDEISAYCRAHQCDYEDVEYHIFKDGTTEVVKGESI